MFASSRPDRMRSRVALAALGICVIGAVVLSVADGIVRGDPQAVPRTVEAWITDFRFLFEQGIYAATVFWAAASFLETRTTLTVGFERLGSGDMSVNGPDADGVVWIGRRFASRLEAEAVATALDVRLREDASA